jgi:hypothetical protein
MSNIGQLRIPRVVRWNVMAIRSIKRRAPALRAERCDQQERGV